MQSRYLRNSISRDPIGIVADEYVITLSLNVYLMDGHCVSPTPSFPISILSLSLSAERRALLN